MEQHLSYLDLGVIGKEVLCKAHYVWEKDDAGYYVVIRHITIQEGTLTGADIYSPSFCAVKESDIISEIQSGGT